MKVVAMACRYILAVTFIFSGFVKVIDPWGTSIKLNEYFTLWGFEWLRPLSMMLSVWLCGAELMMGLMLMFKVRIRLISNFCMAAMTFFTILTLFSATLMPVEDCGCFGDAIKLTPWQTFFKNIVMLPMAFIVWRYHYLQGGKLLAFNVREIVLTLLFFLTSMGIGTYCYRHLPLIDFLPYKIGTNLLEEAPRSAQPETVLVYRDRTTGVEREFALDDPTWHDAERWEWVETRVEESEMTEATTEEFKLHDPATHEDVTREILETPGRLYLICITSFKRIDNGCIARIDALVARAHAEGARVVYITPETTAEPDTYNIDGRTMKTLLRARTGVVVLDDGVIAGKFNCKDVK